MKAPGLAAWAAVLALAIGSGEQAKAQTLPDQTPVTRCENLPPSASIEVFGSAETTAVCREMLKILEGVTARDLRNFQQAAFLLSAKEGYKERDYKQITAELVDIIRLRGLYDKALGAYNKCGLQVLCGVPWDCDPAGY